MTQPLDMRQIDGGAADDPFFQSLTGGPKTLRVARRVRIGDGYEHNNWTDNNLTSATSLTVGTGTKAWGVSAASTTLWAIGTPIQAFASENVWMRGTVTAITSTLVTANITEVSGSGTFADWDLNTVTGGSWRQCWDSPGLINPVTSADYMEDQAMFSVVRGVEGGIAISGASRTKGGGAALAGVLYAVNDGAGVSAHGLYADAVHANALAKATFAAELNATALVGPVAVPSPYAEAATGNINALRLAAGSDAAVHGASYAIGSFIAMINNGGHAHRGIYVEHDAIFRDGDTDSPGSASGNGKGTLLDMPHNLALSWRARNYTTTPGDQGEAAEIRSSVLTNGVKWRMEFTDTAFLIGDNVSPAWNAFGVDYLPGAVNGVFVKAGAAGFAAELNARGSDTNINLELRGKGTGHVGFGAWTSNADAAVNGYITVVSYDGTTRKLATIA